MDAGIGVASTVGVGSVFWCELVLAEAPALSPERLLDVAAPPGRAAAGPQRTVLYVEDNPANMALVEQLIARRPDLRLLTAVNGVTGIQIARAALPDLILMDINLPGISGIDAMRVLRADPATAGIPVVAISANAMHRDIAIGL